MTTLTNQVEIAAPRDAVWRILTTLDLLDQYDPGVLSSRLVGEQRTGLGAQRRCNLRPAGWLVEQVADFRPEEGVAFELVSCSFPVTRLRHDYALPETGHHTVVSQVMTYDLKYGAVGRALDVVMLRRHWDSGIKAFLRGLQQRVEAGHVAHTPE